ncbi:unnamed protein product [Caenorhabditis auriculariae]|uniref:Uncharacterized protein n=1 Tax=Caenorhabditis auriculariae TaxID=2777116 RepID=A0A8S1HRJ1_9PELO|nr:unnamed protein product [Caenorhabditis auriculariae]
MPGSCCLELMVAVVERRRVDTTTTARRRPVPPMCVGWPPCDLNRYGRQPLGQNYIWISSTSYDPTISNRVTHSRSHRLRPGDSANSQKNRRLDKKNEVYAGMKWAIAELK